MSAPAERPCWPFAVAYKGSQVCEDAPTRRHVIVYPWNQWKLYLQYQS